MMKSRTELYTAFEKIKSVTTSCETMLHLDTMKKFKKQFVIYFSEELNFSNIVEAQNRNYQVRNMEIELTKLVGNQETVIKNKK